MSFECGVCSREYAREQDLKAHKTTTHTDDGFIEHVCEWCGGVFKGKERKGKRRFCGEECLKEWNRKRLTERTEEKEHPFVGSWSAVRSKAVDRSGAVCQNCGLTENECTTSKGVRIEVHHVVPVRSGDRKQGKHALSNVVPLCLDCHLKWEGVYAMPVLLDGNGRDRGELPDGKISYVDDFDDPASLSVNALEERED